MKPILLIHGYSTEGKDNTIEDIYGSLPDQLRHWLGKNKVRELDLSRWISLNDGISIDDVSLAMDRALKADHADLLESGFHVIIHSTGALVTRNWIKKFSPMPSPICKLVHLAGANFGSGLAHIGKGQLARWGRELFFGTDCGYRILNELEFGASKTLDLHIYFLQEGTRMLDDYEVQEFCIIGSQVPDRMHFMPIRYVKEDSSDSTVRTAGGNLNFSYIRISPKDKAIHLPRHKHAELVEKRLRGNRIADTNYVIADWWWSEDENRTPIPFAIPYETAHSGDKIGIVKGRKTRGEIMPLVRAALQTPPDRAAYLKTGELFTKAHNRTFQRAAKLKRELTEWDPQSQYEGHAQLIFRVNDQHGNPVEDFDIFLNSKPEKGKSQVKLETMIEDKHLNRTHKGTITFYLRTREFKNKQWKERLTHVAPLDLEITGHEPQSGDIAYVPINIRLTPDQIRALVNTFQTTVVDVTLVRLPSENVFEIHQQITK
ncbi:MAG: hypothetical protein SWH68_13695 [Thermodesulfobacteriota bacterium]|nr:hypothetical protein [Thermodesulfobacteriota bacterium]